MRYGPLKSVYDLLFESKDMLLSKCNNQLMRLYTEEALFADYYAGSFMGALVLIPIILLIIISLYDAPYTNYIGLMLFCLVSLFILIPWIIIWKRKTYDCVNEKDIDFRRDTGKVIFYYAHGKVDTVKFENLTAYYDIFHRTKTNLHGAGHMVLIGKSVDGKSVKKYIKTDFIDGFNQAITFWNFICKYMDKDTYLLSP